ncbi:MAG: hypothetical protein K8J31_07130 [Anaerolineae bacterium]|nr:hypothetical protein [Anaerolineae bacterium]
MALNVLTHLEDHDAARDSRAFYLSEYLSRAERIHRETAQFDRSRYREAVREVRRLRVASVNFLRRHLNLDFPQAAHFIDRMEADGIIRRTDYRSRDARRGWRYEVAD